MKRFLQNKNFLMKYGVIGLISLNLIACGTRDYPPKAEKQEDPEVVIITPKAEPKVIPIHDGPREPVETKPVEPTMSPSEAIPLAFDSLMAPLRDPYPETLALKQVWFWYVVSGALGTWLLIRLTDDRSVDARAQSPDHHLDTAAMHPLHRKIHFVQGGTGQALKSILGGGALGLCTLAVSRLVVGSDYDALVAGVWTATLVGMITHSGFKRIRNSREVNIRFVENRVARLVASGAITGLTGVGTYLFLVYPSEKDEPIKRTAHE